MNLAFRPIALAALACAALAASAQPQSRPVTDFTEVSLSAPIDVHVALGDTHALTLEGDAELLERIETVVENGRLRIRTKPGQQEWNWKRKAVARVTAKRIDALAVAGSGDITAPALTGEALKVSIAGSGDMRLGGKVGGFTASIAGSGDIRASDLDAQRVKVTIAGSGDATVRARETLTVNVSGSGDVRYHGSPVVEQKIMGSGSVRRAAGSPS